jgi:YegS/Rv2252/BmrU family lipid kinase
LNTLNSVFHPAGVEWDASITHKAGDAKRLAQQAAEQGFDVVAAYGGDGTVMEVASGLMGSQVPMAILPGGTANVFSIELGIPGDLSKAATLITENPLHTRKIDLGMLNEERLFILRFATGFEAAMDNLADRSMKDRFGKLSYTIAGMMALRTPLKARYQFTLDGKQVECEGVSCMVANTSNLGLPGVDLARGTDVGDGLLDVVVFHKAEQEALLSILTFTPVRKDEDIREDLNKFRIQHHWQAKQITVESDPHQSAVIDGEPAGNTPCQIRVVPGAVQVLVPGQADA